MLGNPYGVKVTTSAVVPEFTSVEKLSEGVTVSDEFRNDFNEWLDNFFGRERAFFKFDETGYFMHPNNFKYLVKAIKENKIIKPQERGRGQDEN